MFTKSASFYDALYGFKDYSAAAGQLVGLVDGIRPGARSLLDVGCGTGRHLEVLAGRFEVEGLDLNPDMIECARERCPDVPLHVADMTGFDLPNRFDVVTCLFSSIAYVRDAASLRAALETMKRHLAPGGVVIVEPWFTPQTYWTGRLTVNHVDEPDLKITWMYVSEVDGDLSFMDIHYLVGRTEGVEHLVERHEMGLFTHKEYVDAFTRVGLSVTHDPEGLFQRGLYVGVDEAPAA